VNVVVTARVDGWVLTIRRSRAEVVGKESRFAVSMTGSAMRRNIAERLGIASSADIKARRHEPTVEDAEGRRLAGRLRDHVATVRRSSGGSPARA